MTCKTPTASAPLTKLLREVLQTLACILLLIVGFAGFVAIAVFLRPLFMVALLVGAIACIILPFFSPRFQQWLDTPDR